MRKDWPVFPNGSPVPARIRYPNDPCKLCMNNREPCFFHGGNTRGNTRAPKYGPRKEMKVRVKSVHVLALNANKVLNGKSLSTQVEKALAQYFLDNGPLRTSRLHNRNYKDTYHQAFRKHRSGKTLDYGNPKKVSKGDLWPHSACNRFCGMKRSSTGTLIYGCQGG